MSEFKGTNETWFKSGLEIVSMPSQVKIAKVSGSDYEEAKANVQLIKKAPEMLEMLISFVNDFDNCLIDDFQIPRDRFEKLIKEATEL